jgi:SAM-dependent methyltransferase
VAETGRSYDAVAARYAAEFRTELDGKPLDRALLAAVVELAGGGVIADVGAGPGLITGHLTGLGGRAVAVDLSPRMCALAPGPSACADMTALPFASGSLAAIVCFYAVIHLDAVPRAHAYAEFARVLRPGGHALVAFHVSDPDHSPGGTVVRSEWWGEDVDLVFRFLAPDEERDAMERAGLALTARLDRSPHPGVEHPSHRAYLLARRP